MLNQDQFKKFEQALLVLNELYGELLAEKQRVADFRSQFKILDFEEFKKKREEHESVRCTNDNQEENQMYKIDGCKLRRRKNGLWELRKTINGNMRSFYGKTQQEVRDKYNAYIKENAPSKKPLIKTVTLKQWTEKWLLLYKKGKVGEKTYLCIESMISRYLLNQLGKKPINKINRIELQELFSGLEHLGNTKSKLKYYVNDIFSQAYKNKLIKENVAEDIIVSKSKTIHSRALTKDEQFKLKSYDYSHCDLRIKIFYLYCLYSGCRREEALKFNLDDVDLVKAVIHIRGTKTINSDRAIPYFKNIKELFKELDWSQRYVFNGLSGNYLTKFLKNILPSSTIRDMRKTFATNCHEAGISPKVVQKWLGHTTIEMTMDTYTEVRGTFEIIEANKLDDFNKN